jgi:hypothetical protein
MGSGGEGIETWKKRDGTVSIALNIRRSCVGERVDVYLTMKVEITMTSNK